MKLVITRLTALLLVTISTLASAKGDNEIETNFAYVDGKGDTDEGSIHATQITLNLAYLRNLKSYWVGGEFTYDMYRSDLTSHTTMILGAPFKYWLKGPDSKGVGLYGFVTPYLGKYDNGGDPAGTTYGFKLGPSLVVFMSDSVGVDTKIVYDYHKTGGKTWTTTGLLVGFSVFF